MFLHPWAIVAGMAAAGLPVAIHFLTRPRPAPFPLSTIRFVREVLQQRRARHRLRDAIVLLLRTAAVLLIAAAVARPLIGKPETVAPLEDADALRVVVLDVSQSLAAEANGIRLFERARPVASKAIEYQSGLRTNLVLAGAKPRAVFEQPASNFGALRDELAKAAPLPQQVNVPLALNLAGEMLARSESGKSPRRELIVISDFQRSNWATADFSVLPADTVVRLESVAPGDELPNLAVLRVAAQGRPEAGRETRVEVDIGNYSPTPRNVRVEGSLGTAAFQLVGLCAPWSKTTLSGDVLLATAGWHVGEVRLVDANDSLPEDNSRPFVVSVRPPPRVALITRQLATQRPSSSYFLERALAPSQESTGDAEAGKGASTSPVTRLDPANLDPELLAAADLIVIDHPGVLSTEAAGQLGGLLRRGRGILYIASEALDAANLQQLTAAGRVSLPVEFTAPPASQPRKNLVLTEVRRGEPPFQIFGDELTTLLRPLRISGGLNTRRRDGGLADDILAHLSDRSAFLVTATSDAGSLIVLNGDLGTSNVTGSSLFVPLVGELTQSLLGRTQTATETASGESFAVALPLEIESVHDLQIAGPKEAAGNRSEWGELSRESTGPLWKGASAGPPGAYRVLRGSEPVFALATTVPAAESDLRTLPSEVFRDRLAGGRDVRFTSVAGREEDERDRLWTWAAVACIVCLLGELAALKVFRT